MNFYRQWSERLWDSIDKLLADNLDEEDLIDELAEILEADLEAICNDCEWKSQE